MIASRVTETRSFDSQFSNKLQDTQKTGTKHRRYAFRAAHANQSSFRKSFGSSA